MSYHIKFSLSKVSDFASLSKLTAKRDTKSETIPSFKLFSAKYNIKCLCRLSETFDLDMIECTMCSNYQHVACFGRMTKDEVNLEQHICYHCCVQNTICLADSKMNDLHAPWQKQALTITRYVSVSIFYNILHFKYFRLVCYFCITRNEGMDRMLNMLKGNLKNVIISTLLERQMAEQSASGR